MSEHGADLDGVVHGVPERRSIFIPHGIHELPFANGSKDQLGVEGKTRHPDVRPPLPRQGDRERHRRAPRHPRALPEHRLHRARRDAPAREGARRRDVPPGCLEARAQRLGVDSSMIFHNRFVSDEELAEFLSAADVYVTPYLKPEQITSGTLAYAVGSGKPVISTPYWYARELLADGHGVLVPWRDPGAIAREVIGFLANDTKRIAIRERAFARGRSMVWPAVARRYVESFARAKKEHADRLRTAFQTKTLATRPAELPEVEPRPRARADRRYGDPATRRVQRPTLRRRVLPRRQRARAAPDGAARGRRDRGSASAPRAGVAVHGVRPARVQRRRRAVPQLHDVLPPVDGEQGSEDSHGRALWALGAVVRRAGDPGRQNLAGHLFHAALPAALRFTSPRAWAYALLGIEEYLRTFRGDSVVQSTGAALAARLLERFDASSSRDWPWFEDRLTYCNARMPQALVAAGGWMDSEKMIPVGLRSLDWLVSLQTSAEGYFAPIGSNGFYVRDGARAAFDQQPVEAAPMVSALPRRRSRSPATRGGRGRPRGRSSGSWARTSCRRSLYDATTGGCRDGLHADRVNENEGAESTLSFLLALSEMRAANRTGSPS